MSEYFTPSGGMTLAPNTPCDNETTFRAYFNILSKGVIIPYFQPHEYLNPKTKFFDRSPGRHQDTTSWDCDLGLVYLSDWAAINLFYKGKNQLWIIDNTGNAKITFPLWRQPSQVYVIKKRAAEKTSWLEETWYNAAMVLNAATPKSLNNESDILTQWLMIETLKLIGVKSKYEDYWFEKTIKKYGKFSKVFEIYFWNYPEHPILELARKKWP